MEYGDLRSCATPAFAPALASVPPGVASLYGAAAPFGSPEFARRDAADIAPPSLRCPEAPIPGWRDAGSLWPCQRFSIRVPQRWNGRVVVAGCPGQRTEFASDVLFADALLARGYAYAAGNKGNGDGAALLEPGASLRVDGVRLPRFALPGGRSVAFWQHAPEHVMERWPHELVALLDRANEALSRVHGRPAELAYAVGLSNGGYQVRRAIEQSARFDGALTWNAVLWTREHNPLDSLVEAIAAFESRDMQRAVDAGFPPDLESASGAATLYQKNAAAYWYVTLWLHATLLDPSTSIAYGDVRDPEPAESWCARIGSWRSSPAVAARIQGFANTGAVECKTIDVASAYDHLIPPNVHFAPYCRLVEAAGRSTRYRARLLPYAQHVDAWSEDPEYPQLRPGHGAVMEAWDELVDWVEGRG
ncbi:MAG TPA: hypothetical protein VMF61_05420 [Candidatus Acidoferrales bacterium]|nr:hypothetical protein [Candidatus Acidoferrales bacterium]